MRTKPASAVQTLYVKREESPDGGQGMWGGYEHHQRPALHSAAHARGALRPQVFISCAASGARLCEAADGRERGEDEAREDAAAWSVCVAVICPGRLGAGGGIAPDRGRLQC